MSGVLVVGEALVDIVARSGLAPVEHAGGSPATVAVGLGRLGRDVHLLTSVGDDDRGRRLVEHLRASGVQIVPGSQHPGRTSSALVTVAADGTASYAFDLEWRLPTTPLPPVPLVVHTGSIAAVLQPGASTVERIVRGARHHATITYDPNLRPAVMGTADAVRPHVESLVATADVVKLSEDDARWLYPWLEPDAVLTSWHGLGPALVVLTRGADGAVGRCAAGQVQVQVPVPATTVVDTVGAGDSFMAGLIDALWALRVLGASARPRLEEVTGAEVTQLLTHATDVAAVTVSRTGADPPTRSALPRG